ncbi:MAG: MFS transporter, partial [Kiloniellales bacterium]|nr:MFS transporter [Kiloniellales bacterium]
MSAKTESKTGDSRRVALGLLEAVWQKGRPLDEAIAADRRLAALPPRERAFVRALAATCLRRQGQIDALIDTRLDKPLKPALARVRAILRLGAAQACFLKVPPHAAVSTAVELARGRSERPFRGLINAVLRRIAEGGAAELAAQDAGRLNTPDWLWESWCAAYGAATAARIAAAQLADPPLDLSLQPGEDAEAWAAKLDARVLPGGSLRLAPGTGDVARLPG